MAKTTAASPRIDNAGGVIRRLREEAGYSLQDLATKLDWDKGRLSKYENNHLGLSVNVIEQLATALGLLPVVVTLECLKARFPTLDKKTGKVARILNQLLHELST